MIPSTLKERREAWKMVARFCARIGDAPMVDGKRLPSAELLQQMMRDAHIFRVPESDEIELARKIALNALESREILDGMMDTYIQPFPVVAMYAPDCIVMSSKSCVSHSIANAEPGQAISIEGDENVGIEGEYIVSVISSSPTGYILRGERLICRATVHTGVVRVSLKDRDEIQDFPRTDIAETTNGQAVTADGLALAMKVVPLESFVIDPHGDPHVFYQAGSTSNPTYANAETGEPIEDSIEEVVMANLGANFTVLSSVMYRVQQPNHFIVEMAADSPRRHKKSKRPHIRSLAERPVYVSMEPKEIRRVVGLPAPEPGSGRKRAPHERRAHLRRLTAERFKWKRGQIVPVRASWIGPSSGKTPEGREYRVLVDHQSPHVASEEKS